MLSLFSGFWAVIGTYASPVGEVAKRFKFAGVILVIGLALHFYGYYKGTSAGQAEMQRQELEREKRSQRENAKIQAEVNPSVEKFEIETRKSFEEAVNEKQALKILRDHPLLSIPLSEFGMRYDASGRLFLDPKAAKRSIEKAKGFQGM